MCDICIVVTSCPSEQSALTIARALVDDRLAACASLLPGVKSYYYFGGRSHLEDEVKLLIKTRPELFEGVSMKILELHPYKLPEIVMIGIDAASEAFRGWIANSVDIR